DNPMGNYRWRILVLISLVTAAHQGWASNIFTVVSDIFPNKALATVVGLSGFTGPIGGALAASLVGLVFEVTDSYFLILYIAGFSYLGLGEKVKSCCILIFMIIDFHVNN
ncbi:MAG: hypothetical protein Q7T80_18050, partial [Methanoregula sp.]|nr:hypothetical protein [Methanoregula sp.]